MTMIRAAFIGTGGISGAHLPVLKARKDVEIAGLCDVNEENVNRRQREFGGKAFTSIEEMLDAVKPDAVWVCTPPQVRHEPLVECARRGIPTFCEKPVEREPAKARQIAAELKSLGARVQVGYVFRSMPVVRRLREAMADDVIGLVQSFYGCNVSLTRGLRSWFYDKAKSGGALVDQATHNLDLLRSLMGEVAEVRGLSANPYTPKGPGYTIEELIALSFRFRSGALGAHVHTWLGDRWRNEMVFSGRKRVYRLDLGRGSLTIDEGPETRRFQQEQDRMFVYQNERFIEMLTSGDWGGNPCSYDDGLATLELTEECDRAATGGA